METGDGVGLLRRPNSGRNLADVERSSFREIGQLKLGICGVVVREIQPHGAITGHSKSTNDGENGMKNSEFVCDIRGPTEECVGDDSNRLWGKGGEQVVERKLERGGGLEEAEAESVGEGIGVFGVGREAVIGAVEGDLEEFNGGGGAAMIKRFLEFLDVERSVYESYSVVHVVYASS